MKVTTPLVLFFCCVFSTGSCGQSSRPRVSILCVPELSSEDIRSPELQALQRIVSESTVGWMNARTARVAGRTDKKWSTRELEASAYMTLGAGSRSYVPDTADLEP